MPETARKKTGPPIVCRRRALLERLEQQCFEAYERATTQREADESLEDIAIIQLAMLAEMGRQ